MKIKGKITLPRCWKRLVDTVFEDYPSNAPRITGLCVTLPNGEKLVVKSEKHDHPVNDPMPFYDECRTITATMPDGALLQVDLCSGQSNYYAGAMLSNNKGQVIYECEDPIESFEGALELEADNGNTYVVEIEWEGEDPYEFESVFFTAKFEALVAIRPGESLEDAITDIKIPENDQCHYIPDSFEIEK